VSGRWDGRELTVKPTLLGHSAVALGMALDA